MRESNIENEVCKYAELLGWLCFKFTGQKGLPDRIFFRDGEVVLIEFKAEGKRPSNLQQKMLNAFNDEGFIAIYIDSIEKGIAFFYNHEG